MGHFDKSTEQDADDEPWADPAIRNGFEAALGAFILAFNEVDYWIALILRREMIRRNVEALYNPKAMFAKRLEALESIAGQSADGEVASLRMTASEKFPRLAMYSLTVISTKTHMTDGTALSVDIRQSSFPRIR